ncbi:MAG TPA: glycosyltransferase family 9 protein, partial [Pseudonocardia sp.]|nr:glycosyltransferase family 9 protein [Pseudonocardia sp.]
GRERPVLVHPGAQYGSKRWPARRFGEVVRALTRAGRRVLLTGTATERALAVEVARAGGLPEQHVLAGDTDIAALVALVARAGLAVCGDTGIAHLASAFAVPSVVLFGPVGPEQWGPPAGGPHVTLTAPAARRGDPFAADPDPALLAVTVDDVLAAADLVTRPAAAAPTP